MNEPIMSKIATSSRPKVVRDSSIKATIAPTTNAPSSTVASPNELEKKTVRLSPEAIGYYSQLKNGEKITLDGMLEAIAIFSRQNPEVERELIAIGRQVLAKRQEAANIARATTMYQKFR
jgi:hypothetical protein